jgi:hypothetical protein
VVRRFSQSIFLCNNLFFSSSLFRESNKTWRIQTMNIFLPPQCKEFHPFFDDLNSIKVIATIFAGLWIAQAESSGLVEMENHEFSIHAFLSKAELFLKCQPTHAPTD